MTRRLLLALLGSLCIAAPAKAQSFPDRPLRLIVPFAPGGNTDVVARVVAQEAGRILSQSVVVENRTGAGVIVGTEAAAKSPPDGYTLLVATVAHAINPALYARLPYDVLTDFTAVASIGSVPLVVAVHPRVEAQSLREFIALLSRAPGRFAYGSAGIGSAIHMGGELFRSAAGVEVVHVPYRGAGPAMQDLLAGQIQFMVDGVSTVAPHARTGALRPLAIAAARRSPVLPEVPTAAEAGLPGFEAATWNVLLAPARTPPEMIAVLHRAFTDAIRAASPRLAELGMQIDPDKSPAETAAFVRAEVERWGPIVRASGARVE